MVRRRTAVRRFCVVDTFIHAAHLETQLSGTIFGGDRKLHYFPVIGSTNLAAMEAAAGGAPEGSIYLADEQSAGRGRGGHGWHSPAGTGVYLSVVLRPKLPASDALWLSLIAGLAVHSAIGQATNIAVDLRWPNDIMSGEKKLGGILTEISTEGERVRHGVVGIGLNINQQEFPPDIAEVATSLCIVTGRVWSRQPIILALLKSLHDEYAVFQQGNAAGSVLQRFEQRSSYARGARVSVDDFSSGQYSGITAGLDHRGFLRVETDAGTRTVVGGGVRKI
jgi:BirA family transcriptional regulator, biotin operon repressor / biotin---[acetyl-CoA-carboxylase] ligase